MRVAFDIDNTIDAFPKQYQSMMSALKAAGNVIYVITGIGHPAPVTAKDTQEKREYLTALGFGKGTYDYLIVNPEPDKKSKGKKLSKEKANQVKDEKIDILIDNDLKNAKHCAKHCLVLVPFNNASK